MIDQQKQKIDPAYWSVNQIDKSIDRSVLTRNMLATSRLTKRLNQSSEGANALGSPIRSTNGAFTALTAI